MDAAELAHRLDSILGKAGPAAPLLLFLASFLEYVFPPVPGDAVAVLGAWYATHGGHRLRLAPGSLARRAPGRPRGGGTARPRPAGKVRARLPSMGRPAAGGKPVPAGRPGVLLRRGRRRADPALEGPALRRDLGGPLERGA